MQNGFAFRPFTDKCHLLHFNDNKVRPLFMTHEAFLVSISIFTMLYPRPSCRPQSPHPPSLACGDVPQVRCRALLRLSPTALPHPPSLACGDVPQYRFQSRREKHVYDLGSVHEPCPISKLYA